jgi:hypothetical protein
MTKKSQLHKAPAPPSDSTGQRVPRRAGDHNEHDPSPGARDRREGRVRAERAKKLHAKKLRTKIRWAGYAAFFVPASSMGKRRKAE